MCGRYALYHDAETLNERFGVSNAGDFDATYNAAPSETLPVKTNEHSDAFSGFQWGLVPPWADDDTNPPINARAETIAEKPTFEESYRERRCIVPVSGFYEWADGTPYYLERADGEPLGLAGVWATWTPETKQTGLGEFGSGGPSGEAEPRHSFAVVTTEPAGVVADLHHRQAVVVEPENEDAWLYGDDPRELFEPSDPGLVAREVSTAVNDPTTDHPGLVEGV